MADPSGVTGSPIEIVFADFMGRGLHGASGGFGRVDRRRDACATFVGGEDELAVAVEFGAEFAGEVFDAGGSSVLDDVLDGSVEQRAWSLEQVLVADAGDAQLEPIELVEARGDDGEDGQVPFKFVINLRKIDYEAVL